MLVIGDLSFHEFQRFVGGKALTSKRELFDDDGGGIFSFLPRAEHRKHFEMLFGTPIMDFRHAVDMYGGIQARERLGSISRRSENKPFEKRADGYRGAD